MSGGRRVRLWCYLVTLVTVRNVQKIHLVTLKLCKTTASYHAGTTNRSETMPFLIPVLVGIPVLFGGGYVIYHLVH